MWWMRLKILPLLQAESVIDFRTNQNHRCQPAQRLWTQNIHYQSAVGQKIPDPVSHFSGNEKSGHGTTSAANDNRQER